MTTALHVDVNPALLVWACERAGIAVEEMASKLKAFSDWMHGTRKPTLKQLEAFAHTTHVPMGYFFLPGPPDEGVPIPDFRTVGSRALARPSGNLLDVIYACQRRQDWYREHAREIGAPALPFVGAARLEQPHEVVAAQIREAIGFSVASRHACATWAEALSALRRQIEGIGVLVMASSVVGNDTHRKLDPDEFRGFALVDDRASVIFVNSADSKSAQMFTLVHELAHVWLGATGLSDAGPSSATLPTMEAWCNRVAAEVLVPIAALREVLTTGRDLEAELKRLVRMFKVSSLVMLRRLFDVGYLTRAEFAAAYARELALLKALPPGRGGDFYRSQNSRVSRRFAEAVLVSMFAGETTYREAMGLLGLPKMSTLEKYAASLGVR